MRRTAALLAFIGVVLCAVSTRTAAHSAPADAEAATESSEAPATPGENGETLDFTGAAVTMHTPLPAPTPARTIRTAQAAPARNRPPAPLEPVRSNALNLSVLGFVIGAVRLTYERLILPKHGLFGEAIVAPDVLRGFAFVGVGGPVGYRYHWRGAKTSGFVGGTLSVTRASGTIPTFRLGDEDTPDFRGSVWTVGIAPHVGKRWFFEKSGVNLTLRFGGGFAYHAVDAWRGTEPKAKRNLARSWLSSARCFANFHVLACEDARTQRLARNRASDDVSPR